MSTFKPPIIVACMAKMILGIDTSMNKRYCGITSGYKGAIDLSHHKIQSILAKHGKTGVIHWRTLSKKIRKAAEKEIFSIFERPSVCFRLFEHKKPINMRPKEYFLKYVPLHISGPYEHWLKNRFGVVEIQIHNDYTIKKVKESSDKFAKKFLDNLTTRLSGSRITTKTAMHSRGKCFISTVRFPVSNNTLNLFSFTVGYPPTPAIQLSDLFLGYCLHNKDYATFKDAKIIKI